MSDDQKFMDEQLKQDGQAKTVKRPGPYGVPAEIQTVLDVLKQVSILAQGLDAVTEELMAHTKERGLDAGFLHGEMALVEQYNALKEVMEKPSKPKDESIFAYFHRNGEFGLPKGSRYTVAYERMRITHRMLADAVMDPNVVFTVRMGVAFCHTNDRFNKRVGREFAVSRIRPKSFKLVAFGNNPYPHFRDDILRADRSKYTLMAEDGTQIFGHVYHDTDESRFDHIWVRHG